MRARERAFFRGQPSAGQLDRAANQLETIQRCPDRRHGVGDERNPVETLRRKRSADRDGIDMDSVDDEPGGQPAVRQRGADDSRLSRTHRRHCIEQVSHAGHAIVGGLRDNDSARLAVTDRNPHA